MATDSTRVIGNEPADAIDPGGTRSTKAGKRKAGDAAPPPARKPQHVVSGDRNAGRPESLSRDPK